MSILNTANLRDAGSVDPTSELAEPSTRTVTLEIADRVAELPGAVAVDAPDATLSYAGLWERSGIVARRLAEAGVASGERVAICADRTGGFVVGLLGVLRLGAVAVPLSADLPAKRRLLMASEAGVSVVLLAEGAAADAAQLHRSAGRIVVDARRPEKGAPSLPPHAPGDGDPAYVYFTSGSTGVPKGVLGTHRGLSHFVVWQRDRFDFGPGDRVALLKTISFDAVLREVFTPLVSGATICVPPTTLEAPEVLSWVGSAGVTVLHATPALAEIWLGEMADSAQVRSVRLLILAGEILTGPMVEAWRTVVDPSCEIVNMYGPTETTMVKTYHVVPTAQPVPDLVPVGRPLPNTQVLVVSDGHLCGVGESGEVLLRTRAATLGYINNPEEQSEAFIVNPFTGDTDDIVYRTGDSGYLSEDGTLTVTDRIDDQVKVLGVRIELGEVAAHIRKHPAVDAVAVVPEETSGSSTRLVAHVVAGREGVDGTDLRRHLSEHLPRTMIPSRFVFTDALPLTANGKVDVRALQAAYPPAVAPTQPAADRLAERLKNLSGAERAAVLAALREKSSPSDDSENPRGDGVPAEQRGGADGAASEIPLSFSQERLWFLDRLDPGSAAYNMKIATRLEGPLDESALREGFGSIEARHAVLRTRYPDTDGHPRQVIDPAASPPFETVDASTDSLEDQSRLLSETVSEPFDLAKGPIWRIRLIRTSDDTHLLIIVIHHIAADGWSIPILMSELEELYTSRLVGREPDLPTLSIQYADHARNQRRRFTAGAFDEGLVYWAEQLAAPLTPLDLPTDRPRPQLQTANGGRIEFELESVDTAALNDLCAREGVTPSIAWLALFNAFLYRYSGITDIVVGGPSADRDVLDTEQLVGFFVNTLAYRTIVDPSWTFRELLGAVRRTALDAYQHREVPFERVVIEADAERDPSRTPIFQVMLQYGDRFGRVPRLPGITAEEMAVDFVSSKFDLELELAGGDERILGRLTYNADLYEEETVRRMMRHLGELARSAVDEPDRVVDELPLMAASERDQLVASFSGEDSQYFGATVIDTIQRWVDRTPSATAVVQAGQSISYAELGQKADSITARLISEGVTVGDRVALLIERSPGLIAAILGVLGAGAAYVPLDPAAPDERNDWILADARLSGVLVDAETPPPSIGVPIISVSDIPEADDVTITRSPATLDTPAYVIYTSGSTGRPKGVVVEHRSLAAFAAAANDLYGLNNQDRVLQFHSVAFDTSVEEIFTTLTAGGQLILRTEDMVGSVERLVDEMEAVSISVLQFPTAFWNIFAAHVLRAERPLPSSVHTVIIGGEAADPVLVDRWKHRFGSSVRLINAYGPTETTVTATAAIVSDLHDSTAAPVPIGKPLHSATAFVVDRAGEAVPIGVHGELWIGGPQVARGYFEAPELTEAQFVEAPLDRSGRVYRTGDVVRWRPDGNLEFLGRVDRQLKVRGFRIEPGEIEAQLVRHPDVSVAFVHLWEDAREPALVGYVVGEPGRTPVSEELVDHLKSSLPAYMVPLIEVIDELPRNQSDKVDTTRLPKPSRRGQSDRTPPRGDAMIRMAGLWGEILGVEDIGAEDRFFEIGGHSLLAVEMISRVEREFRTSVPLATIFSYPSLEEFTRRVTVGVGHSVSDRLVPISPDGDRRPLFCLPVTDGSVLAYHRLTRHLAPDIPIYGIQGLGADGVSAPYRTIEDMCSDFADIIMESGPGPHRLLGASYAGLLAVETANNIIERGGAIDLAVMLDTVMPRQDSWLARQRRREQIIRSRGTSGLAYVGRDLWKRARVRLGRLRHTPRWWAREVANRPLSADLAGKRLTHVSLEAERRFEPKPYRGSVLYFRATGEDLPLDEHRDAPWRRYVGDFDVVDSAGTHWGEGSMLDEPHLADLCNELNRRLALFDGIGGTP